MILLENKGNMISGSNKKVWFSQEEKEEHDRIKIMSRKVEYFQKENSGTIK